ncbi:MAG: transporter associated domain-containing protein [Gammaproteobacteria bacterium]|nr:transporter associated domain-containing protein [Gammaproteobacteria bacterium]
MSEADSDQSQAGKSWLDTLTRMFSGEPNNRNELVNLLREAQQRQVLDSDALSIIEGALLVADMQTREIMIPRSQVVVIKLGMGITELLPLVIESGHSRFPVIGDGPDDVVGILLAKDLLSLALDKQKSRFNLKDILRPCTAVPESKRLNVLLQEFRSTHNHLAVVYDEHGGVAGIVTIEDVLEQIVGEIEDEFDVDDEDFIKQHSDNTYTVKALVPIDEFNECFGSKFSEEEFDTIGGIVISNFGHVPKRGEKVEIDGYHFEVLNSDQRRVKLLQLTLSEAAQKR